MAEEFGPPWSITKQFTPSSFLDSGQISQRNVLPFYVEILDDSGSPLPIPKLRLLVPPSSLEISMSKIVNRTVTRGGYIEEHWGDNLDELSASGSTASFMDPEVGLTRTYAKDTLSWDNFNLLFEAYRNNGLIYGDGGWVQKAGMIRLSFDNLVFDGYFTQFTVTEAADRQFAWNISWNFKSQHTSISVYSEV